MKNTIQAIVLAAGKSTRFNTKKTKLIEPICGQPMILFITKLLASLEIDTTLVIGHEKETIKNLVSLHHGDTVRYAVQHEQRGTGHAIACSQEYWNKGTILVINGDMPLITSDIIIQLYEKHTEIDAAISFVTACSPNDPSSQSYGRVVKKDDNIEIIEAKDFDDDSHEYCCVNAGIYMISKEFLNNYITSLNTNNASNEFYITDLIKVASDNNYLVATVDAPFNTIRGINTLEELWVAEQIQRAELVRHWMNNGVRFTLIHTVHIDINATIGHGSYIGSGVHLSGKTTIGENCHVQEFSTLENTTLDDNVTILSHCVIKNAYIQSHAHVGPFAHIRNNTIVGKNSAVGNFVEVKNSTLGDNTKAKHLTYLGDATIGSQVNIGAGTIVCNYNGVTKNKTIIHDNVFIGSNNTLIAPITIGENAFTAAGSTITDDVPNNALAIARVHQTNKQHYAEKLRNTTHSTPTKRSNNNNEHNNFAHHFSFVGAQLIKHDIPADEQ
jgi:bifunctional UDP-N-acetylglucosamine pyrophosphorylase/glucosamine-1-phosphate N-acetyltransferase